MNLRQINYILAVCEHQSFGAAAKKCFVTQSTLSTMIARFEEEFCITLFDRKQKPILPTEEGAKIIDQLRIIFREVERLDEVLENLKGGCAGDLKIGVIPTVGPYLMPLFLNDFARQFPGVHFEINEITTEKIAEKIKNRSLDIGIVSIPLENEEFMEHFLYAEPFLLFDEKNSFSKEVKIEEIPFHRMWLLEEGHCLKNQVLGICDLYQSKIPDPGNLHYKSGTIDTLMKFVKKNQGVTLLPFLAGADLPEKEKKFLHPFINPKPARNIGLIVHRHFVGEKILKALIEAIQNRVNPLLPKQQESLKMISPLNKSKL